MSILRRLGPIRQGSRSWVPVYLSRPTCWLQILKASAGSMVKYTKLFKPDCLKGKRFWNWERLSLQLKIKEGRPGFLLQTSRVLPPRIFRFQILYSSNCKTKRSEGQGGNIDVAFLIRCNIKKISS